MKKFSKIALVSALAVGLGFGGMALAGCNTTSPDFDIRVEGDYIQWTKDGESWENLISVDELKGEDADVWTIGADGYWYLNDNKTDYVAVGKDADVWTISDDGYWELNGEKTEFVAVGKDGADGKDGENGQDGIDGVDGEDGNGIVSVEIDQTKSDATKTVYVITFDNGKTFSFEVLNGYVAPAPVSPEKIEIFEGFKTEYKIGEELDVAGGILTYTNETGKEKYVAITEDMVTGFTTSSFGERNMVITYQDQTILYAYEVVEPAFVQFGVPYYTTASKEMIGTETDMYSVFVFNEDGSATCWQTAILPTVNNAEELFGGETQKGFVGKIGEWEKTIEDGKYVLLADVPAGEFMAETRLIIEDENTISVEQIIQTDSDPYTITLKKAGSEDEGLEYGAYYVASATEGYWAGFVFTAQGEVTLYQLTEEPTIVNIAQLIANAEQLEAGVQEANYSSSIKDGALTFDFGEAGGRTILNEDGTLDFYPSYSSDLYITFSKLA